MPNGLVTIYPDDYYDPEAIKVIDYGDSKEDLEDIVYMAVKATMKKYHRPLSDKIAVEIAHNVVCEIDNLNTEANYEASMDTSELTVENTPVTKSDPVSAILIALLCAVVYFGGHTFNLWK